MPYYSPIKDISPQQTRMRTVNSLIRLRQQLDTEMPKKTRDQTLVLGTWNIRNFDDNRFGNGVRTAEDLQYIAEIISRFDVLAVQELCDDTSPLDRLLYRLGKDYRYIITDMTEGRGGNYERLGFIYDRSKVSFKGMAGELVLEDRKRISYEGKKQQFSRTPFMCNFQAGWFKFLLSTVHVYFGSSSGKKYKKRINEIEAVAEFIANRAKKDSQNHILVGDFNIMKKGSHGYNALENQGFEIFANDRGSNKDETKYYDQISFLVRKNELRFANTKNNKGVFNFFKSLYLESDFKSYKEDLSTTIKLKIEKIEKEIEELEAAIIRARTEKSIDKKREDIASKKDDILNWEQHLQSDTKLKNYYLHTWRTFHGSDHYPLWVELEIDFSNSYLERLKTI